MADPLDSTTEKPVLLLGMGRAGIRIAERVRQSCAFPGLVTAAADTDRDALQRAAVDRTLVLGEAWAQGQGCGGDVDLAEKAVWASGEALRALLRDARVVFGVAGLGGGLGSTGLWLAARLSREAGIPAVFLVTTPFSFEGATRMRVAESAEQRLRSETQALLVVPNSILFARLPPDTVLARAFEISDDLLARAVGGMARVCCARALLPVDLAGLKALLKPPRCTCSVAQGQGHGPDAVDEAVREFLASPFLGDPREFDSVQGAFFTVLGGEDLAVGAVQDCLEQVQQRLPRNAQTLVGAYTDPAMQGRLQLTGLLVRGPRPAPGPAAHVLAACNPAPSAPRRTRRAGAGAANAQQAALPLSYQQLGVFAGSPHPTFHDGENLDVPTFQRRNVPVDPGVSL